MTQLLNNDVAALEEGTKKIALWVAIASILQISESLIPHPIPGIRFGFANMVTLVILANYSFGVALKVALLRTVVSSFMIGTFMGPSFILSFFGAMTSTLVMGMLYQFSIRHRKFYFSLIGISVLGALTHNMTQLVLAYLLLIRHTGIFLLLPWLAIGAVAMGIIAGTIASNITKRLISPSIERLHVEPLHETGHPFEEKTYVPGNSLIHKLRPETKILCVIALALAVLFIEDLIFYSLIVVTIVIVVLVCRASLIGLFTKIKKLSFLILVSFFLPVFLNSGGEYVFHLGPLGVTGEALIKGIVFASRIIILVMTATVLVQTTTTEEITLGLKKILAPLKPFGIDPAKTARIITLSWQWIPELWNEIRGMMKSLMSEKGKGLRSIMAALTDFLVFLFQKEGPFLDQARKTPEKLDEAEP